MKRVTVIRALILAAVLFAMVLPFAASAQAPTGVAVRGYVKGDCGDKGVIGAVVEIYNVQTGQLKGKSVTASEFGDWIISLSGTVGNYRIVVTLPVGSGAQVVAWAYGAGAMQQTVAGPVDQVIWQLGPATPFTFDPRYGIGVYGPLTIFTDEPCTSPEANGPSYVYGRMYDTATPGWYNGLEVQLWRESNASIIFLARKFTNRAGMFGFGITPVTAKYMLTDAGGPPGVRYKEFAITAGPGKGPMNLGTIKFP